MPTWVSLLRAVNLGPRNKVSMPRLREALEASGFEAVQTYVQSGNIVARSVHRSKGAVAAEIGGLVEREFGFHTPVVVRTKDDLSRVVAENPFSDASRERPRSFHVVFLDAAPAADRVAALHGLVGGVCRVESDHLYVDYQDGVHGSKLTPAFFSRQLGVEGTARNWQTVLALEEIARPH